MKLCVNKVLYIKRDFCSFKKFHNIKNISRIKIKKKIHTGSRLFFVFAFIVFGLNGFFKFFANPPVTPEAGALLKAFADTGYFFPMIKSIELITGMMLLTNFFAPLATILITPIMVGITTIHLFLNPAGLPMMAFLHLLHGIIAFGYKENYKSMLILRAEVD